MKRKNNTNVEFSMKSIEKKENRQHFFGVLFLLWGIFSMIGASKLINKLAYSFCDFQGWEIPYDWISFFSMFICAVVFFLFIIWENRVSKESEHDAEYWYYMFIHSEEQRMNIEKKYREYSDAAGSC